MSSPSLTALLHRLDCILCDLDPDKREPIEEVIGLMARSAEDAAKGSHVWEEIALHHARTIESLRAEVHALRDVARQRHLTIARCETLIGKLLRMVDRAERRAGRRLMKAVYGRSES